ncbi:MAG TPA: hypothetical protein VIV65_11300 [Gemmatimonadaceae bacterium]
MRHLLLAAALVFPVAANAQATTKSDTAHFNVVGKWTFTVQTGAGNGSPSVTFLTQKGDSITGHYSSANLGERDFIGTYKGNKIGFWMNAESGGQSFSMSFSGTVDSADSMSGTIDIMNGMASGEFLGKRVKDKPPAVR